RRIDGWKRLAGICRRMGDISGEVHALASTCQEPGVAFGLLRDAVGRLNILFQREYRLDTGDRRAVAQRISETMGVRVVDEGNATECSRVAWLYLYLNDRTNAQRYTEFGLAKDADNEHCHRLARRFNLL